jgi:hypothetical protein
MSSTSKAIWDTMATASRNHGETNDCTVLALTAATGLTYDECHAALAKTGRRNRKGCTWYIQGPKAARALGFDMRRMEKNEYRAKTMITAERDRALRSGHFVCQVSRHVAAVIDGKVIDWSAGRRKIIQAVYECTPIPGFAAPVIDRADVPAGSATWQAFKKYKKADNLELF